MKLGEKIFFGNYPLMIIFYPLILLFRFVAWVMNPNRFCRHEWEERKLESSYGVFGGMKVYKCKKCGEEDWEREAEARLKRNGLI